jgi:hypothetical protein
MPSYIAYFLTRTDQRIVQQARADIAVSTKIAIDDLNQILEKLSSEDS